MNFRLITREIFSALIEKEKEDDFAPEVADEFENTDTRFSNRRRINQVSGKPRMSFVPGKDFGKNEIRIFSFIL